MPNFNHVMTAGEVMLFIIIYDWTGWAAKGIWDAIQNRNRA
jgi:hypothetical protein